MYYGKAKNVRRLAKTEDREMRREEKRKAMEVD
jgi:hypothetical protein